MKTKLLFLFAILVGAHCPDFFGMSLQAQDTLPDVIWSVEFGNNQIPYDAKFSPDGTIIAHGLDGYIQIRNASNGELIKQYDKNFHGGWEVTNINFSPEGNYLFTGGGFDILSDVPYVLMWNIEADTIIHKFEPDDPYDDKSSIVSMDISPNGINLAAIIYDKQSILYLYIWDILTGEIIIRKEFEVYNKPYTIRFSPDGKYLALARKEYIELYDANTFEYITKLGSHEQRITDIAFSPDGELMGSVGEDAKIKIYDLENKTIIVSFINKPKNLIRSLCFNITGDYIITGGGLFEENKIWELNDTLLVYKYNGRGIGSHGLEILNTNDKILSTGINSISLLNGKFNIISVPEEPGEFETIYPNPTNNRVVIVFNQPIPAISQIKIFNETGQEFDTIFEGFLEQGSQEIIYECSPLPNGIYFINILTGADTTKTYKLIKE